MSESLVLSPKDQAIQNIFGCVRELIIYQVLLQAEQTTPEDFKAYKQRYLKEIHQNYQDLVKKFKCKVSKEDIKEIVDDVFFGNDLVDILKSDYLTGTSEEKDKIIQQIDLEKLNQEYFTLVTSYIKKKGGLKKKKGFGNL